MTKSFAGGVRRHCDTDTSTIYDTVELAPFIGDMINARSDVCLGCNLFNEKAYDNELAFAF